MLDTETRQAIQAASKQELIAAIKESKEKYDDAAALHSLCNTVATKNYLIHRASVLSLLTTTLHTKES